MPLEAGRNGMLMTDLRVDGSSRPSKDDIRRKMLQLRSNILGDDHKRRSSQVMQLVMADEEHPVAVESWRTCPYATRYRPRTSYPMRLAQAKRFTFKSRA